MNNKILNWLCFALVGLMISSCYKDKGSNDYIDYNKAVIEKIDGAKTVFLGDTLRLQPILTFEDEKSADFSYEWYIDNQLISTDKNLELIPTEVSQKWFNFYLIDNHTGIKYRIQSQITVQSPYYNGWLILSEKEGRTSLSYLRRQGGVEDPRMLFNDIYHKSFPNDPLGTQPKRMVTTIFPNGDADEILIIQGNKESVFLDGTSFKKNGKLSDEFEGGVFPNGQDVQDYFFYKTAAYANMMDGSIYWKKYTSTVNVIHTGKFFTTPYEFQDGSEIHSFIEAKAYDTYFLPFFDHKNGKLLSVYAGNSVSLTVGRKTPFQMLGETPPGFVLPDQMQNYDYVYGAEHSSGSNFINLIRNKLTGEYLLQDFTLISGGGTAVYMLAPTQQIFAGQSYLQDDSKFYKMRRSAYMFFSAGSKLYYYDFNTKLTKLYHDFGGAQIVDVESGGNESEFMVATNDGKIFVCVSTNQVLSNALPGENGGIVASFEGLGKIVQVAFKWGNDTGHYLNLYD